MGKIPKVTIPIFTKLMSVSVSYPPDPGWWTSEPDYGLLLIASCHTVRTFRKTTEIEILRSRRSHIQGSRTALHQFSHPTPCDPLAGRPWKTNTRRDVRCRFPSRYSPRSKTIPGTRQIPTRTMVDPIGRIGLSAFEECTPDGVVHSIRERPTCLCW